MKAWTNGHKKTAAGWKKRPSRNGQAKKLRILLADDHIVVRRGIRRILEDEKSFVIVGEAGDSREAVELVRKTSPDVVVMDCLMPEGRGIQAAEQIVESSPHAAVLMLSGRAEEPWMHKAAAAGARGYLVKNVDADELVSAIKRVASGETVFPWPTRRLVEKKSRAQQLSAREREVLQAIVDGKSTREIAAQLGLSVNTVSVHRTNIMNALRIRKAAKLVVYAIREGLAVAR